MDIGDDAQLVGRCLRGEVEAFEPLVARYQKVLFNVALRLLGDREDARDVTQSAFTKAFEKLHTYDPAYRFFSWIYRIALNESLNLKHRRPVLAPLDERIAVQETPFEEAFAREMSERIQAALLKLAPEYREVVVLRHFGELAYSDIAAALGVPEKTVKSRLYTARQRLAELLLPLGMVQ
jgi:RNA polymerase sigma-70 factor (ECF subfamily)